MYLTNDEERIINGEQGEVMERMLRLLVRLGDIYNADKLIPIGSAQVSGISYKSIGDPGLKFLEDLAGKGAKAKVLSYINPAGMDLENWKELGFGEEFAEKQMRIIAAFTVLFIRPARIRVKIFPRKYPSASDITSSITSRSIKSLRQSKGRRRLKS